ncbi:RNA polymerase sigma factor [Nonomuraea sp. NPDC050540]|uniref:RNA polymerase sigma factor n=1 Tax=Nonomuraea sp. NPDC050540 TaxID=3364367 RepID=UPI0037962DC4
MPDPRAVHSALADAHRREWAHVLAATVRITRELDLAEECVQEAYVAALDAWSREEIPANTGAWLVTTARRKALDALRRDRVMKSKLPLLVADVDVEATPVAEAPSSIHDDRLRLIFMCCHPALNASAQVALTLRLVCGVRTPDIAKAFLVSEPTMAARLTRAKKKIALAHIPFRVPRDAEVPSRVDAVLTVIHLLFTAGHTAPHGTDLTRADLQVRAIDLARLLYALMPGEREIGGLLALMLVNHARQAGRTDADGRLVLLQDQDRSTWDRTAIAEGHTLIDAALRSGPPGRFVLQAAIALLHATAPTYDSTDWVQILQLYDTLRRVWPSPVVELNRAVALAMVHGPEAALRVVERLEEEMDGYQYVPAVKGELLRRLDRFEEAAAAYRRALDLTDNEAERAYLNDQLSL